LKWFSAFLFMICVNLAVYILASSQIYLGATANMPISPQNLLGQLGYNLTTVIAGIGVGLGVGGIMAFITKQYVFGVAILLIWVLAQIAPILQWVFGGLPIMMNAFGVPSYIVDVVDGLMFLVFFMGILEIASYRWMSST
jgi:hypothetical protein